MGKWQLRYGLENWPNIYSVDSTVIEEIKALVEREKSDKSSGYFFNSLCF